jgi:cytoskeletal protein RodZ
MDKKSLGQTLRQAREQRGQSLDALAAATRIPSPVLDALERDDFGQLPADVYVRGFVRSYCRAVGLPEAEPMVTLEEVLGVRRQSAAPDPGSKPGETGRPIMPVVQLGSAGRRRIKIIGGVVGVLVLAALAWFLR